MIIECQACRSRFRLDETKIKGKGARVRCRRCGEPILVMKEDAGAPPGAPPFAVSGAGAFDAPASGQFDIGSAVEASLSREEGLPPAPSGDPASAPGGIDPFAIAFAPEPAVPFEAASPLEPSPPPAPEGPAGTVADEEGAALEFPPAPAPADDFLDLGIVARAEDPPAGEGAPLEPGAATTDWPPPSPEPPFDPFASAGDEIASAGAPAPTGFPGEADSEASPFAAAPAGEPDEVDLAFEQFLAGAGEPEPAATGAASATGAWEPPRAEESPFELSGSALAASPEPPPEPGEPAPFLMDDADSLDFLRAGGGEPEPERRPVPPVDEPFSFQLDEEVLEVAPVPPSVAGARAGSEGSILRGPEFDPGPAPSAALPDLSSAPEADGATRPKQPPLPQEFPVAKPSLRVTRPGATRAAGIRPGLAAAGLLFLLLAAAGGYFGFTSGGRDTLRSLVPALSPLIGGDNAARRGGPSLDVRNLIGYYDNTSKAGRMFVIKGQVANVGETPKGRIRIHAALLDAANKVLAEKTVYAGNVLGGEALRTADRETIESTLSSPFGEKLANLDVAPGKSVPFMVVFLDIPDGIDAYRLEAKEGD